MEREQNEQSPILDKLVTSARKAAKPIKEKAYWELSPEEKLQKKFNRAYQRFMLGRGFRGEYRLITLTTPETFKGDIHQAWRKWVMRMRRRGLVREYYAVKEWNENTLVFTFMLFYVLITLVIKWHGNNGKLLLVRCGYMLKKRTLPKEWQIIWQNI